MRIRKRDLFGCVFFALFWLLPATYQGLFDEGMPGWPLRLSHLTSISCLFTHKFMRWPLDYVQVQKTRDGAWETLPLEQYFRMMPFGYRTRMGEMLDRKLGMDSVLELAVWFRKRHAELHPNEPRIHAVRFVSTFYDVGASSPAGRWRVPPLESFPEDQRFVWFTRAFAASPELRAAPVPAATP